MYYVYISLYAKKVQRKIQCDVCDWPINRCSIVRTCRSENRNRILVKRNEELYVEKGNARKGNGRNSSDDEDDDNDTISKYETQSDVLTFGASAIVPARHTQ